MDPRPEEELHELTELRQALDSDGDGTDDGYQAEYARGRADGWRRGFAQGAVVGVLGYFAARFLGW